MLWLWNAAKNIQKRKIWIYRIHRKYFRKKLLATLGKHETRSLRLEEFLRLEKLFVDSLKIETAIRNISKKIAVATGTARLKG